MSKPVKLKSKLESLLEDFDKVRKKFYKKVEVEGFGEDVSKFWWDKISGQASYSFAKSHSRPYSHLTYLTMYLKHYYPKLFFTSLLNNTKRAKADSDGTNKITSIIYSAKKDFSIKILKPDINESKEKFVSVENGVRFGFDSIKDVGKASTLITKNQPYESFEHFLIKVSKIGTINKRVVEALIFSGCFDSFDSDRNKLYNHYSNKKKNKDLKQTYFTKTKDDDIVVTFNKLKLVQKEIEYLNYSFDNIGGTDEYPVLSSTDLSKERIRASAYIESFQEKVSKKSGKKYIYLKLTDFGTNLTTMIFGEEKDNFIGCKPEKGMLIRFEANKPKDFDVYFINKIKIVKK
jgi:DNA polymerase III alpha subunit